jgi:adenylate cyclase
MNIILGHENVNDVGDRHIVLELDTMRFSGSDKTVTAYCLVEQMPLEEMFVVINFIDLHTNLMKNYRLRNWKFCEDALEHLRGKWRGELDSFYDTLASRVAAYQANDPGAEWDGVINKEIPLTS